MVEFGFWLVKCLFSCGEIVMVYYLDKSGEVIEILYFFFIVLFLEQYRLFLYIIVYVVLDISLFILDIDIQEKVMKQIIGVYIVFVQYWVGDGFLVCLIFFYQMYGQQLSFFLLFDYVGLYIFLVGSEKCGVGEYLYCGFEIVIIVYVGEVEYCDFIGCGGVIGSGDVQWMMVGVGILYEEFYLEVFICSGGELKMIQLWVNLFVKDKMVIFGYQSIIVGMIFIVVLVNGVGQVWVIVGQYDDVSGLVYIFLLFNVWDLQLNQGYDFMLC